MLDLDYAGNSAAGTDANFVQQVRSGIVEIQGTAEEAPFSRDELNNLLDLAEQGCQDLFTLQRAAAQTQKALIMTDARPRQLAPGPLVLATHNPGKVPEIAALVEPLGYEVISAGELGLPEPEETGTTYRANAELKALASAQASGKPALADDSGLSVAALGGAPGLFCTPGRAGKIFLRRCDGSLMRC